jgi:hypothetical protein
MDVSFLTHTNGKGLWSEEARSIEIVKLSIGYTSKTYYPEDPFNGELRAHFISHGFTPNSWNVPGYGLIYTDKLWLKELKKSLREFGFSIKAVQNVHYSEQGLQGDDYVSMDIGPAFWASWKRLNKTKESK